MSRSGISPIIATILLLMITITLAGVGYIWIRGLQKPKDELNKLNLTCEDEYVYRDTSWKVCIIENPEIPCKKILIAETVGYKMAIDCLELRGEK